MDVLVDGDAIVLSGQEYIMPPLPLIKVPTLAPVLRGSSDPLADAEYVNAFVGAVFWSLKRNYPAIQYEEVEFGIDMTNFTEILAALIKVNALGADSPGEVTPQ